MAIGTILLIASLVLTAASIVLQGLAKPAVQDAKLPGDGSVQVPTASESRAVPILWGTRDIKGPNVIWHGDLKIVPIRKRMKGGFLSSGKVVTVGFKYLIGMDLLLCYGPLDRVTRLEIGDKVATEDILGPFTTTPEIYSLFDPFFFGGQERGGGIRGDINVYGGLPDQIADAYLIASGPGGGDPNEVPAYVDIAHAVAEQFEIGESPFVGPFVFRAGRFPDNLGLAGSNHIPVGTIDDGDANPAEAIYEMLTNTVFGLEVDPSQIAVAEFIAAGDTLATEGLGISQVLDSLSKVRDIVANILEMIDGILYEDTDSVFHLKLIRDDFGPVAGLELYDEANVLEVVNFSRSAWSETVNHVNIKYTDRTKDNIETGAMAQDLANFRTTGRQNRIDIAMPTLGEGNAARIVAERELRQLSFPLAQVSLSVTRVGQKLRPGDVIRFSWAKYGITDMALRVLSTELGTLNKGEVTLKCTQDVFRISETIFANPGDSGWVPADLTAIAFVIEIVRSVPRIYMNLTFAESGELSPLLGQRIHSMARRPNQVTVGYEQFVDLGAGAGFEGNIGNSRNVTPGGALQAAYSSATPAIDPTGFTVTGFADDPDLANLTDPTQVESGFNVGLIAGPAGDGSDDEIFGWDAFVDNGDGTADFTGIHRGLMDTAPRDHLLGAEVFLFSDGQTVSDFTYTDTQAIDVKHQAKTAQDILDVADATSLPLTFPDRLRRPHHPSDLTVNATRVPQAVDEAADLDFDWTHRTNDESDILDNDVASPNAQDTEVEYDLEFQHAVTGAVLRNETRVSPAPAWLTFLYTQANLQADTGEVGDFPLRVLTQARYAAGATNNPPNLTSLQESDYVFNADMGGSVLRSAEMNDTATLEMMRTAIGFRGYANRWTKEIWIKWGGLSGSAEGLVDSRPLVNDNGILLTVAAATQGQPFRVRLWNDSGSLFKDFDFGSIPAVSTWTQIVITFDGAATDDPLLVYQDGTDVTGSATLTQDDDGTQTNQSLFHMVGAENQTAQVNHADIRAWGYGIWTVPLGAAEITTLWNSGSGSAVTRRWNHGNYVSAASNMHLWDFRDTANPGQDFGNDDPTETGALVDIMGGSSVNMDASDLIADTP